MKIVCPGCSAEYNVDEARMPPEGMKATCPKCMTSWVVQAGADPLAAMPAPPTPVATTATDMDFDPPPTAAPPRPVAPPPPPPPPKRAPVENLDEVDSDEPSDEREPVQFEIFGRSIELPNLPFMHLLTNIPVLIGAGAGLLVLILLVVEISRLGGDLKSKNKGWSDLDFGALRIADLWDGDAPLKDDIQASGSYEDNLNEGLKSYRLDTFSELKKAEVFFRKAAKLKRTSAGPQAYLASVYAKLMEYDPSSALELKVRAGLRIHRAMRLGKTQSDAQRAQAELFLAEKKYGEAQSTIQIAFQGNDNEPLNHIVQGRIHLAMGATEVAQKAFEKAVSINAQLPSAQYHLGLVLDRTAIYADAQKAFEKALELSPGHSKSLLALAQLKLNRFNLIDNAVQFAEQIIGPHKDKAAPQEIAAAHYIMAQAFARKGEFDKALAETKEGRTEDPRNVSLIIFEGELRSRQESTFNVEAFVDEAVKGDMKNAAYYLYKGQSLARQGKPADAIGMFNKVVALDPSNARAFYELGINQEANNEPEKALQSFEKSMRADRGFGDAYVRLASLQIEKNNLEAATKLLNEVNGRNDRIASVHNLMGVIALKSGDLEKAHTEFNRALEIDPRYVQAYRSLVQYYVLKKDLPAAIKAAEQAKALDPDGRETLFMLGDLYVEQQKFADAFAIYDRMLSKDPKNTRALMGLGKAAMGQKNWTKAIEALNKALETDETNSKVLFLLGLAYFNDNKFEEAAASLQSAQRFEPKNPEIFMNLGLVAFTAGKMNEAVAYLKEAVTLRPNYYDAHGLLAKTYSKLNLKKDAIEAYEKQISLTQDKAQQAQIYYDLGEAHRTDLPEEAMTYFKKSYALNKKNVDALFGMGQIHEENNNVAAAIQVYQLAVNTDKKFAAPHRQLGYIYQAQGRNPQALKSFEMYLKLAPVDAKDRAEVREQISYLRGG